MNLFKIFICFAFLSFLSGEVGYSKILILEDIMLFDNYSKTHGETVTEIACRGQEPTECSTVYSEDLLFGGSGINSKALTQKIYGMLQNHRVVNLSFAFQLTERVPDHIMLALESSDNYLGLQMMNRINNESNMFFQRRDGFKQLFQDHQDVLFVVAAGNGFRGNPWTEVGTPGVSLSKKFKIFPAFIKASNKLNVASVDDQGRIADYSNFGLETVDLAAPLQLSNEKYHESDYGTSFSAPFVSRISNQILNQFPELSIAELVEILMKSCVVRNLDRTVEASLDLIENKENSIVFKALYGKRIPERRRAEQLVRDQYDILLVRSGGVLSEQLAMSCAEKYILQKSSIQRACIEVQEENLNLSQQEKSQLLQLWDLRGI